MNSDDKMLHSGHLKPTSTRASNLRISTPASHDLTIEELDQMIESNKPKRPLTTRSINRPAEAAPQESSRAVAMAMKALQTKLHATERDNEALKQTVQDLEERYLSEKDRLQEIILTEQQKHSDKEQMLTDRVEQLLGDVESLTDKLKAQYEKFHLLEEQKTQIEAEAKLSDLKSSTYKSQMQQKVSDLQHEVEETTKKAKKYKVEIVKLGSENSSLASNLKQCNDLVESLQQELSIVNENSERTQSALQDNILHMEAELTKLNAEYVKTVNGLEDKNYHLNEVNREQSGVIEQLKREVESLKVALANEEEARMKLLRRISEMPTKDTRSYDDFMLTRDQSAAALKHSERRETDLASSYTEALDRHKKSRHEPDLSADIEKIEGEIQELNKMYRRALKRSYTNETDLSHLKGELNSYTRDLEAKNTLLYKLKRQQQARIRDKLARS